MPVPLRFASALPARCPPRRSGRSAADTRVSERTRLPPYRLRPADTPPALAKELEQFYEFLTVRFYGEQEARVAAVTADKYIDIARGFLGWLHLERGVPLCDLSLTHCFPSPERAAVAEAFAHLEWLVRTRQHSPRTELTTVRALVQIAKFLFRTSSTADPREGDKPFHDIPVIRELRKLAADASKRARTAPLVADEEMKWLEWPKFLACVEQLRLECAERDARGRTRSPTAIAWSLQSYLVFAILACVPDRQRTLRELRIGKTLRWNKTLERWEIRHGPSDYKTGKDYGERPPLVLSPRMYPELELFLQQWRSAFAPDHDFVFSKKNGKPLDASAVYKIFTSTTFRLTGKRTNPHLVRDMIVTHLRSTDVSERELEALAIYMGHSLEMQKSTYDRRTKAQKVAPAVDLLESLLVPGGAEAITPPPLKRRAVNALSAMDRSGRLALEAPEPEKS